MRCGGSKEEGASTDAKAEEPAKVENVEINYTAKEKRMSMTRRRIAVR